MKNKATLIDSISEEVSTCNREKLKGYINRKASWLIEFHPSNRPKDLDPTKNPELAHAYSSKPSNLVLCAKSEEAIPVLEEGLSENGFKLVRVDCRLFSNRNSMVNYIAEKTQFSHNGSYAWSPMGVHCDTSIPWDYFLLFDHVEAFDPIDEEGNVNSDLYYCLRAIGSILKNDSHQNLPTIALVEPDASISNEFFTELYTKSYASSLIY